MKRDPFAFGSPESDFGQLARTINEIDGDILVADSCRKHPQHRWGIIRKSGAAFGIALLLFVLLFSKLYYLQVVRGADYYGAAEGNRIRQVTITPPRGIIYDRNGRRIAYNVPIFALYAVPQDLPKTQEEEDAMFSSVADVLDTTAYDLVQPLARIERTTSIPVEIARDITQEQTILLAQRIKKWPGLYIAAIEQRAYEIIEPLSHVIGYTGPMSEAEAANYREQGYLFSEHVGKTGIEKTYQDDLRGKPGAKLVEVNSFGTVLRILSESPAIPGKNVYLNIDADLQLFIWNTFKNIIEEHGSPGGSVVVMNPQNGALYALVSYPGYNNELFSRGIAQAYYQQLLQDERNPLFNRAIGGEYPSGSTFKIVVGSAALEEGVINRYTSVLSTGGIRVGEYFFPDWKYGGHGQTNIIHALADSVNTFFYAVGGGWEQIEGLGVARITDYGRRFGLDALTMIDLPAERTGFLPSKEWKEETKGERWFLGDTYHLAIGQGDILVTPLQIANVTAAIANDGTLYAPFAVAETGRDQEHAIGKKPVILNPSVASPSTVGIIQEGLRAAVTYGSARLLTSLPVPAAGKTGTAEFSKEADPHAWFTGFAPYRDAQIVVTVMVEQGEGGTITATPIAKKAFQWWFGTQEDRQKLEHELADKLSKTTAKNSE